MLTKEQVKRLRTLIGEAGEADRISDNAPMISTFEFASKCNKALHDYIDSLEEKGESHYIQPTNFRPKC